MKKLSYPRALIIDQLVSSFKAILLTLFLVSGVVLASSVVSDEELSLKIIGIWSSTYESEGFHLYGETNYKENGTTLGKGRVCIKGDCETFVFSGKYQIKNGFLISETLSSNSKILHTEKVITDQIELIDKTQMILIAYNEKEGHEMVRVTNPILLK